jgi:hypothetical protein
MSRNCESNGVCAHSLELEFINEKYRELLASNSVLREQLNHSRMQDPINMQKYLKLCEELTKVSLDEHTRMAIKFINYLLSLFFRNAMN